MRLTVNMHQAKSDLSRLVARALEGDEVIIARRGQPVARLVPVRQPRVGGLDRGKMWISPDFDDPLPEDLQRFFEGR